MTRALDDFVADAKAVTLLAAFQSAGGSVARLRRSGGELVGACPSCGGKDRFSLNERKQVFNCRRAEGGGPLALVRHLTGCDFLAACETVLGRDRPGLDDAARRERAEDRERADAERARRAQEEAELAKRRDAEAEHYRQREWDRCLGDWREAAPLAGSAAEAYLAASRLPMPDPAFVRCHPSLAFWRKRATGNEVLHRGPAMLVLFVSPQDGRFHPIGLHRTWIDLGNAPKFRPTIRNPDDVEGEPMGTKKMRGSKNGGLLPLLGRFSVATRQVAGEGIETVLGFAAREGVRSDTFYCAAGDLGNLCGKAARGSRVRVPGAAKLDSRGRGKPVFAPGDEPDLESLCMPVADHVRELVLLGDGDSEPVMTEAALMRGLKRHAREGRDVCAHVADDGKDWRDVWLEAAA